MEKPADLQLRPIISSALYPVMARKLLEAYTMGMSVSLALQRTKLTCGRHQDTAKQAKRSGTSARCR